MCIDEVHWTETLRHQDHHRSSVGSVTTFNNNLFIFVLQIQKYISSNLTHTFVDASQSSVVHLVRAVEHHHVFPQTATHVFSCLCLTWRHTLDYSNAKQTHYKKNSER